jgi:UDP-N-acetylmuramoyl-L-alanyl-D-glutamate--2,6-diaminopimelate ligase
MRPLLDHTISVEEISRILGIKIDLEASLIFSGATSRDTDVVEGDLFLAYPGEKTHGARFAVSALSRGARAILTDAEGATIADGLPVIVVPDARTAGALISATLYARPMQEMVSIGITGTDTTLARAF